MLKKIREALTRPRRFRLALAQSTPLIFGPETRKVARAIRYDTDKLAELATQSVPFEPRESYPERALEWAHGQA